MFPKYSNYIQYIFDDINGIAKLRDSNPICQKKQTNKQEQSWDAMLKSPYIEWIKLFASKH